ncbi:MAG: glucosamine-6-phosphate deaminase [Clostridiales bacterium]|nr:glucosamine-6-phosphate deaminase [Clostridiales bacterium]
MRIIRTDNYDALCKIAADIITAQILLKPNCVLGLATGSSPVGVYKMLVQKHRDEHLDFSRVRSFNLDEYVGLSPNQEQSYAWFMSEHLFKHINILPANTDIPNGIAENIQNECDRYDAKITSCGGIDLQLLGIGQNGHIGFNEPSSSFTCGTNHTRLSDSTIKANKQYFETGKRIPTHAITMGCRDILQSKRALMIALGDNKALAVRDMLTGPITPMVPASILQLHRDFTLIADGAALSKLENHKLAVNTLTSP